MRPDQIDAKHEVEARCCVSCKSVRGVTHVPQNQWTCGKWVGPTKVFDPVLGYVSQPGFMAVPLRLQRGAQGQCGPTGTGWEIHPSYAATMRSIETEKIGRDA